MDNITIRKLTSQDKKKLGIPDSPHNTLHWSVWKCQPSTFPWKYSDKEIAYLYQGRALVKTSDGQVELKPGDLVTFPKGLSCTWEVLEDVCKVYKFE